MKVKNNKEPKWLEEIAITLWILSIATIAAFFLKTRNISDINIAFCYILAILMVSRFTQGYTLGMIASFVGMIMVHYFVADPGSDLHLFRIGSIFFLVCMLLVSVIMSAMRIHNKEQLENAMLQEERTNQLNEINNQLLITSGLSNTIDLILKFCVEITNRTAIFYKEDPQQGDRGVVLAVHDKEKNVFSSSHELFVAHWVFENKKDAGVGTDYSTRSSCIYLPFVIQGKVIGVMGIYCANQKQLSLSDRKFLKLLISQGVMALERQIYIDHQQSMILETEKEKMRGNLLRAVSHDLRTPLTGIIGASATLLEHESYLDLNRRKELIRHINEDSTWLLHMVENLLSVTRIHEDSSKVNKVLEPVEEVVAEAVMRLKKRYQTAKVEVKVPDELLMVPMDVTLIEQVLINLMENSIKYSKSQEPIHLTVESLGRSAIFSVADQGRGLEQSQLDNIFDGYSRDSNSNSDTTKGMGIGLSICKTIILAHGGTIEGKNRLGGGAIFTFTLPLEGGQTS
ncbi:MAG TPA: DUF4118 domain-containing protein [Candidatus Merdenecus merdavium]|nr:DUF4118 domain-containing protein [Candidatus Merdenecus merdavium]